MSKFKTPTKKYGRLAGLFETLSWALLVIPMAIYIVSGFIIGSVVSKVILGLTAIAAIIILLIAALQKTKLRSPFWIVAIGLSFCLTEIYPLLLIMGAATLFDELVFSPLGKHYRTLYTINREIDKRG